MEQIKTIESRAFKSSRNAIFSLINQIATIFIQFLVRTIFIKTLAAEYLGLNGLFSNILSVLSLAELGLGTAIVCNMYGPLARNDEKQILIYFNAYRKIYFYIGLFIGVAGLCILPFVNYLVADADNVPHLKLFFGIYLADTVSSYFFAHYKSLFTADQKDYINTIVRTIFLLIQTALQITLLLTTHNFIAFLVTKICCDLLSGFVISVIAKKKYPFIKNHCEDKLNSEERKQLISDSYGVLSVRIGLVVLNSTDSIIISAIFGSIITGYYSNYYLIIGSISTAIGLIFSSVEASIGNYCTQNNSADSFSLFKNIHYIYYCFYGFSSICLVTLLSPFIQVWIGTQYLFEYLVVIIIVLNFYLNCSRQANLSFITVNHLLKKTTIKNIIEPIINLAVSIILAKTIGLIGVFIGTAVSLLLTSFWFEPFILYKDYFKARKVDYFKYMLSAFLKMIIVCAGAVGCYFLVKIIFKDSIWTLIGCFAAVIAVSALVVTIPFVKTNSFRYLIQSATRVVSNFKKKKVIKNEQV